MEASGNKIFDCVWADEVLKQLDCDNYLIEYDENVAENNCCIYFSSHAIYYPETRENFEKKIVGANVFEWYRRRIPGIKKHIFVRDIRKQFYVEGINNKINSITKLYNWLYEETKGYSVITVGSSAGGYASAIIGTLLNARKIYCFSAQFSLIKDFAYSSKELLIRHENDENYYKYYNLKKIVSEKKPPIIYLYPNQSECDVVQAEFMSDSIDCVFPVVSNIHGVPIYRCCIEKFLSMGYENLLDISKSIRGGISPFGLSKILVGSKKTYRGWAQNKVIHILKSIKKLPYLTHYTTNNTKIKRNWDKKCHKTAKKKTR